MSVVDCGFELKIIFFVICDNNNVIKKLYNRFVDA